jgi:hypothetical protein
MWRCERPSFFYCTPAGCKKKEYSISITVDFVRMLVARCDAKGCDSRAMQFTNSGIWTVIDRPGSATILKIRNDGTEFVEVVTLWSEVFTGFGACTPLAE